MRLLACSAITILLSSGTRAASQTLATPDSLGPVRSLYIYVTETDGTRVTGGGQLLLGFDPNGDAFMYVENPGGRVAYHGTWSYARDSLSLQFPTTDFTAKGRFPLRLSDDSVTLPFQVFTTKPGSSTWSRIDAPLEIGIFATYDAAVNDPALALTQQAATDRAYAYASARIRTERTSDSTKHSVIPMVARVWPASFSSFTRASERSDQSCDTGEPMLVLPMGAVHLLVEYTCSPPIEIALTPLASKNLAPVLRPGALMGDPRVFLDPTSPKDPSADPPSKDAVIVSPFTLGPNGARKTVIARLALEGGSATVAPDPSQFSISPALVSVGYRPHLLENGAATVEGIIDTLKRFPSPGVLIWEGHGDVQGNLEAFDHWPLPGKLGKTALKKLADADFKKLTDALTKDGFGDLVLDASPDKKTSVTLFPVLEEDTDGVAINLIEAVSLTPRFWVWAQEKLNFNVERSLVYVDGCESAKGQALRAFLQARSFIGWSENVSPNLGTAVLKYLVASLMRPTHSTEEAVYNLRRVAETRQMIYIEDKLLDQRIDSGPYTNLDAILQAYGKDDTVDSLVDYRQAGWNSPTVAQAQVWWLLFAARWSSDRTIGEGNIVGCYQTVWSTGKLGGIGNPFCNNANDGALPTAPEVEYATYLLTGTLKSLGQSFKGPLVPRFTLADGR